MIICYLNKMLQVVELKPDGKKIPVTNENRVEYIHRMSDYLLNKRVRQLNDYNSLSLSQCFSELVKVLSILLSLHADSRSVRCVSRGPI